MDANPYQTPKSHDDAPLQTCNFCGQQVPEPVVQAPDQDVFICAKCIEAAKLAVEQHSVKSLLAAVFQLGLGILLIGILAWSWMMDDLASMGGLSTTSCSVVGPVLIAFGIRGIWSWRNRT